MIVFEILTELTLKLLNYKWNFPCYFDRISNKISTRNSKIAVIISHDMPMITRFFDQLQESLTIQRFSKIREDLLRKRNKTKRRFFAKTFNDFFYIPEKFSQNIQKWFSTKAQAYKYVKIFLMKSTTYCFEHFVVCLTL